VPPSLSVVIPAWNRAGSITSSVASVLAQDFGDFEVVVVDDGSTDSTADVVASIPDPRLRLVRTPHQGVSAARNTGAATARGSALIFLDSDDEALPGWLAQLGRPILDGHYDLVVSGWQLVDAGGSPSEWQPEPGRLSPDDLAPRFLAGSWAVRHDVFDRVGGFDPQITYGENTEIALRLLLVHELRAAFVDKALVTVHEREREVPPAVRARNTRVVLAKHHGSLSAFPRLWASYLTLVGVDDARNRHYLHAAGRFAAALRVDPRGARRTSRLLVSLMPFAARRVWGLEPR
jgi:glycosyltransferase involved in cell wall biosynthesis